MPQSRDRLTRPQLNVDRSHTTPLVALHKRCTPRFTNSSLRPLSGTTHGHALSPLRATHGLWHSASQDVRTHRRQTHRDNNSQVETPAIATDAPAHSRAMLPGICNATDSGEHSVRLTTLFPVFFWSSGACAALNTSQERVRPTSLLSPEVKLRTISTVPLTTGCVIPLHKQ